MKILVFAHQLEVGGTQTNSIELAAALRDIHGYDVVIFATPGPRVKLAEEKGLRYLPAPDARFHPSLAIMRALREAVRSECPDLLHVWDWWQCLEAYYAVHLPMRVPMVVTDMRMVLTRILPKRLPTTFGTPEMVDEAKASGRQRVELLLPTVDVKLNAPGAVDPRPFQERYGIKDGELVIVTVSRLANFLKAESLYRTLDAVSELGRSLPLRFVIVGDGMERNKLERLAAKTNTNLGRPAVVLTGELHDPRPAYAAADIFVGMGSSALRAMAFAKPTVIVGEQGFSAPFTPETSELFYYKGMYGRGNGNSGNARLIADMRGLAENPTQLPALGEFSRQFVVRHFSLEMVSERLADFCRSAMADVPRLHVTAADALRTAAVYLKERRFFTPSRDPALNQSVETQGKQ
jgi:glycosyltransferase involved in cell wall biosynthesis